VAVASDSSHRITSLFCDATFSTASLAATMILARNPSKQRSHAFWRIVGGYLGLALIAFAALLISWRNGMSAIEALQERPVEIFTIPVGFAAFSVASAVQFRAHLSTAERILGCLPALVLVVVAAFLWHGV
jgi:hypothetical protein